MTQEELGMVKLVSIVDAISKVDGTLAACIKQQHVMVGLSNVDDYDMESMRVVDQGAAAVAMGLLVYCCPWIFDDDKNQKILDS